MTDHPARDHQLIRLHKPYNVLCQFSDTNDKNGEPRRTLAEFIDQPGFYPAGRLDYNSEGLVILTNSGALQARISDPSHKMEKTYWVQVEGAPAPRALAALAKGVRLNDGLTRRCKVARMNEPPVLATLSTHLPDHRIANSQWIKISLTEGKNRQVRRMFAHIGHPVLRLIRSQIGHWHLHDLAPGAIAFESIGMASSNKPLNSKAIRRRKTRHR